MPELSHPTWGDADLVLISALEHWSYCPRQCALIHIEQVWDENLYTLRGHRAHEKVDLPDAELTEGVHVERALPLWSARLGLVGKADIVEYHGDIPYPVEYKHGPRRRREHDDLQLCAQALCLEEMSGQPVPCGAIYHHSSRRRREVVLDAILRARTEEAVREVRALLRSRRLPPPVNDARCDNCSLRDSCMPGVVANVAGLRAARLALFIISDDSRPAGDPGREKRESKPCTRS
jgi:CRISPR-associated exonuclease Cas4